MAAVAEDQDQAQVRQQLHARQVAGSDPGRPHGCLVHVVRLRVETIGLERLRAEPLDHPHTGDALLHDAGQLGGLALDRHGLRVEARGEALAEPVQERQRPECQRREDGVDEEEDHRHRDHRHRVRDGERDEDDEVLDLLEIGVGPAHQLTRLRAVVEGEVEPLYVGEEAVAKISLGPA